MGVLGAKCSPKEQKSADKLRFSCSNILLRLLLSRPEEGNAIAPSFVEGLGYDANDRAAKLYIVVRAYRPGPSALHYQHHATVSSILPLL